VSIISFKLVQKILKLDKIGVEQHIIKPTFFNINFLMTNIIN